MNNERTLQKGQRVYFNTGNVWKVVRVERHGYTFITYHENGMRDSRTYQDEKWINYMLLANKAAIEFNKK